MGSDLIRKNTRVGITFNNKSTSVICVILESDNIGVKIKHYHDDIEMFIPWTSIQYIEHTED